MFYDAFAALIGQSGDAMQTRQESPSDDPRSQREGRQIATFLRRTAVVWDDLFATLQAETRALERGLEQANEVLRAHGLEPAETCEQSDPLERYRALNRGLDAIVERLTPLASGTASEAWASDTLRALRANLAEAFEIQGRLVDRMLEVR
jgi:hypothetical protein